MPKRQRRRSRATGENEWVIGVPTSRARYRKVKAEAERLGLAMAAFVRQVIDEWFERHKRVAAPASGESDDELNGG